MERPDVNEIFTINTDREFNDCALKIFQYQAAHNEVYREYLQLIQVEPSTIHDIQNIPYLPIGFFKSRNVVTGGFLPEIAFTSSGTTGSATSHHQVRDLSIYEKSFLSGFQLFYGNPEDWCFLALLPSYLERKGSSLVYMCDHLIRRSKNEYSDFYLNDLEKLSEILRAQQQSGQKTILIGVTFALLDLAEQFPQDLSEIIVMETGGMKGRRKEMIREEVHEILTSSFGVENIHSEYGMTELLSQAYSSGGGIFQCPPWIKITLRDPNDPFSSVSDRKTGGINIIDLANIDSCAFLATDDLGRMNENGFEVLGRFDASDVRGCNLLVVM